MLTQETCNPIEQHTINIGFRFHLLIKSLRFTLSFTFFSLVLFFLPFSTRFFSFSLFYSLLLMGVCIKRLTLDWFFLIHFTSFGMFIHSISIGFQPGLFVQSIMFQSKLVKLFDITWFLLLLCMWMNIVTVTYTYIEPRKTIYLSTLDQIND